MIDMIVSLSDNRTAVRKMKNVANTRYTLPMIAARCCCFSICSTTAKAPSLVSSSPPKFSKQNTLSHCTKDHKIRGTLTERRKTTMSFPSNDSIIASRRITLICTSCGKDALAARCWRAFFCAFRRPDIQAHSRENLCRLTDRRCLSRAICSWSSRAAEVSLLLAELTNAPRASALCPARSAAASSLASTTTGNLSPSNRSMESLI